MLNSIHHIAIICSDKDKALHFYHDLLGFPVIRSNYREDRNDWKIDLLLSGELSSPHTELELFIVPSAPPRPSYYQALRANHEGMLDCADLLRRNKELGGEKKPHCDGLVFECVALVEKILREHGKLPAE